ncbi:MAG: HEAT repeat domain-containing protein, partial [Planctomycetes bacterium]|nr:HEAT repeat domain-containing protein [Planctomycetota bacterium]
MGRTFLLLPLLALALMPPPAVGQDPGDDPLKKQAEMQYEKFLADLESADSIVRARGVEGLRRVGLAKAVVPLLDRALGERYAYIVQLCGETARVLDPASMWNHLQNLVASRGGGAVTEQRNLVILLRECGTADAGALCFERFAGSGQKHVVLEVIRTAGVLKHPDGTGLIKRYLGAPDLDARNAAAVAAARYGLPEFVPMLLAGLEVSDSFHGKFAAWALTRIEDPSIFFQVQGRLGSASGEAGESKAKALEGCAFAEHVPELVGILNGSTSQEYREAAAIALGRLKANAPDVQEALFARLLRDPQREVRGACWHALSRNATEALAPSVLKRLSQRNAELSKYVFQLAGDLKIREAASTLLKVIINEKKDALLRYAAQINYWRTADAEEIRRFESRMETASGQTLEHGVETVGFRRHPDGFDFLLKMLRILRDGSPEELLAEKALERMTGHFFGPDPGLWKKWYSKNPEFFTPKQSDLERNKWREDFDKENKGFRQTEETEYAVQLGLEWLARHQHPDGRIDPQRFYEVCEDTPACIREGARFQLDPVGTTALSVLAFLGAGYSPSEGKYRDVVGKALEYLMARQQANGDFLTNDLVGGYHRPLGVQAFAEAYLVTRDPAYAWYTQKGVDFLTTIQNGLGGWRYRVVVETTDTSCMSWNLFALKSAEKAGLDVKEIAFAGCYRIMDMYSEPVGDQREDFIDIDPEYG